MKTLRRKSKWRSKNQRLRIKRSEAPIEREDQTRRMNRADRAANRAHALADELAGPAFAMTAGTPPTAPALRVRFTVEVFEPSGKRTRHAFTSTYSALFGKWNVPATRICEGVRGLLSNAPRKPRKQQGNRLYEQA